MGGHTARCGINASGIHHDTFFHGHTGGGHGGGGSSSGGKKTTSAGPGTVTEEPVLPEQPAEVPIENIPAQGLPKTGEDGVNTSALMLTLGLIASAYVWMSGRREEEENRKN